MLQLVLRTSIGDGPDVTRVKYFVPATYRESSEPECILWLSKDVADVGIRNVG